MMGTNPFIIKCFQNVLCILFVKHLMTNVILFAKHSMTNVRKTLQILGILGIAFGAIFD